MDTYISMLVAGVVAIIVVLYVFFFPGILLLAWVMKKLLFSPTDWTVFVSREEFNDTLKMWQTTIKNEIKVELQDALREYIEYQHKDNHKRDNDLQVIQLDMATIMSKLGIPLTQRAKKDQLPPKE